MCYCHCYCHSATALLLLPLPLCYCQTGTALLLLCYCLCHCATATALQAWNHAFFWQSICPGGGGQPSGPLAGAIQRDFGGYAGFAAQFMDAGQTQFGSGWAWLCTDGEGVWAGCVCVRASVHGTRHTCYQKSH